MRVNMSKAAGPDNIPGHVLRTRANQLVDVITDIFNISPSKVFPPASRQPPLSLCLKKSAVSTSNDYHPVALS